MEGIHSHIRVPLFVMALMFCALFAPQQRAGAEEPSFGDWIERAEPNLIDYEVMSIDRLEFRWTDRTAFHVKVFDFEVNSPVSITFDEGGLPLEDRGRSLQEADVERRWEVLGAIDEELWALAIQTDATTAIPVMLWLRSFESTPDRQAMLDDPSLQVAVESSNRESRDRAYDALAETWSATTSSPLWYAGDAPVAYSELNRGELFAIADHPYVASIYWDREPAPVATSYVDTVQANVGVYDGSGRRVCVIEPDRLPTPNSLTIAGTYCGTGSAGWHGQWVTGIIRSSASPYGVATLSADYFANWGSCDANAAPSMQYCADQGADIWNFSHTCSTGDNRLFDYHAKASPYPLVVVAAGNQNDDTAGSCPAQCTNGREAVTCKVFNGLVVGGTDDCADSTRSNDKIWCGAADSNVDGRELPHLVAPARELTSEGFVATGTSGSAPQVAGAAAQISELEPALDGWPEASRAVLMVSADEDVDNGRLSLSDGIDDRDGAGELSIFRALTVAAQRTGPGSTPIPAGFYSGVIYSSSTPASSWFASSYRASHATTGGRLRVVLTWDSTATCTNPSLDTYSCSANNLDADLDLYVFRDSDGALMASSTSNPNSYEFVEFATASGETYTAHIWVDGWTSSATFYGVAWRQGLFHN